MSSGFDFHQERRHHFASSFFITFVGMVVLIAVIVTNSRECPLSSAAGSPTFLRLYKPCRHMTLNRIYCTANPHCLQRNDDTQSFILAVSSLL